MQSTQREGFKLVGDFSGQFLFDHLPENIERLGAYNRQTIDEEGWGRTDAEINGKVYIGLNSLLIFAVAHAGLKRFQIQPQILRILSVNLIPQ